MSEPSGDTGGADEVLDLPVPLGVEEQCLGQDARLTCQPGRGLGPNRTSGAPFPFDVDQETRELQVGIPKSVDDADAVAFEDIAGLFCRVARNQ